MFTSKGFNKRIDKIHERLLRLITLNDYESSIYGFPPYTRKHFSKVAKTF